MRQTFKFFSLTLFFNDSFFFFFFFLLDRRNPDIRTLQDWTLYISGFKVCMHMQYILRRAAKTQSSHTNHHQCLLLELIGTVYSNMTQRYDDEILGLV